MSIKAVDPDRVAMRLDKWLWAARFFKTRSLAQQAVEGGKVKLNGQRIKPAKAVQVGDRLVIHIGEYEWVLTVCELNARRGPAEVARKMYAESPESHERRQAQVAVRKVDVEPAGVRQGRPTKRDRRAISRFKRD